MQADTRAAHCQIAISHTAQSYQFVGELLDLLGIAANDDNLQAVVMVHMDMSGGNDLVMVVMLYFCYLFLELVLVVVVDQGYYSHDVAVSQPRLLDQGLADKIANGL